MNKDQVENDAGAEVPADGETPQDDLALTLDLGIPMMLGLRAEVTDGLVKVWPREVLTPDETNFLIGARFSENLDETRNVLDGLGAKVEIRSDAEGFVGVITAQGSGELITTAVETPELAGACGLYALLWALRRSKK